MTETIKAIRREMAVRNLTQREFADMTGFYECTISKWMNGHRTPKISDVETMVAALDLRIELKGGKDEIRNSKGNDI